MRYSKIECCVFHKFTVMIDPCVMIRISFKKYAEFPVLHVMKI